MTLPPNDVRCSAEALFGSSARRTEDALSDRDYLIVDDDNSLRTSRARELERAGFSVASYTWRRLHQLSEKGGLFVQHLKQEALILWDEDDNLKHELGLFEPKPMYSREIEETKWLLGCASVGVGAHNSGGWVADVLAVGLRNLAILSLAERGHYIFDYDQVLKSFFQDTGFNRDVLHDFRQLRTHKARYRKNGGQFWVGGLKLTGLCDFLARSMGCPHATDFPKRDSFCFLPDAGAYFQQRLVEHDLLFAHPACLADGEQFDFITSRLSKKLKQPRDYGWEFAVENSVSRSDIEWLKQNSFPGHSAILKMRPQHKSFHFFGHNISPA